MNSVGTLDAHISAQALQIPSRVICGTRVALFPGSSLAFGHRGINLASLENDLAEAQLATHEESRKSEPFGRSPP